MPHHSYLPEVTGVIIWFILWSLLSLWVIHVLFWSENKMGVKLHRLLCIPVVDSFNGLPSAHRRRNFLLVYTQSLSELSPTSFSGLTQTLPQPDGLTHLDLPVLHD